MPPKIQIIGNEDTAIPYLQWAKKQWNRREGTWYAQPDPACLIQFHRSGEYGFIRFIVYSYRGFLTHPRNGTVRGFQFPGHDAMRNPTYGIAHTGKGFTKNDKGVVTDDGDYEGAQEGKPYPLIDEDEKQYLFTKDNDWTADGPQEFVYGNVDWKGPTGDDRRILTYKGNPSRYWPVGNFVEIPGLSSVDHSVSGMLNSYEYMTVFGDKVYEGGQVLAEMPWLYHPLDSSDGSWSANHQNAHVLGAAIRQSDDNLICVVKTCYNSYPDVKAVGEMVSTWQVWDRTSLIQEWYGNKEGAEKQVADSKGVYKLIEVPDPGRGYWIEVIVQKPGNIAGGWKRLIRISTPTWCDVNWFFSEDGTKACSVMFGELHKIEISGDNVTHTTESLGGFKNTIKNESTTEQESNPGTVPAWAQGSLFGGVYREGIEVGDWINMTEVNGIYTSVKSGTTTIAADYKGNELVKMSATITGNERGDYRRLYGTRWGKIATMPYIADRWAPDKRVPGISVTSFDAVSRVACVQISGACKPSISINGHETEEGSLCVVLPCVTSDTLTISATVTDKVTGLSATSSRTFEGARSPGYWVTDGTNLCGGYSPSDYCGGGFWYDTGNGRRYYVQICRTQAYDPPPPCTTSTYPCSSYVPGYPYLEGPASWDGHYGYICKHVTWVAESQHWECV